MPSQKSKFMLGSISALSKAFFYLLKSKNFSFAVSNSFSGEKLSKIG
jgi:hypothetical protein